LLTAPVWLGPLAWLLAYHPSAVVSYLGLLLLFVDFTFVLFALVAAAVLIAAPVLFLFRAFRFRALTAFAQAGLFLASYLGGLTLGRVVWLDRVNGVVERGEPLVAAIHEYVGRQGRPPGSLDELIPQDLAAIPSTGIGAFPQFRYVVGEPGRYDGNPWVLLATPPCHPMGFDALMYFPVQNYPAQGYGGALERVSTWAYVHE
jgi:hypothetical protein